MLETIKAQLLNLIKSLGYNCTDNGRYEENFPWLMLRVTDRKYYASRDVRFDTITFVLDVFSTYPGEKEIVAISENIITHLESLRNENPNITAMTLQSMRVLDDKATGPVRKHGVLTFRFLLTSGVEVDDDSTGV